MVMVLGGFRMVFGWFGWFQHGFRMVRMVSAWFSDGSDGVRMVLGGFRMVRMGL